MANDRKIKSVELAAVPYKNWTVGICHVTMIIDVSIQYHDCIYPAYEVYVGDKVISRIENCPVVVEYE